jgi:hypothetical protein
MGEPLAGPLHVGHEEGIEELVGTGSEEAAGRVYVAVAASAEQPPQRRRQAESAAESTGIRFQVRLRQDPLAA